MILEADHHLYHLAQKCSAFILIRQLRGSLLKECILSFTHCLKSNYAEHFLPVTVLKKACMSKACLFEAPRYDWLCVALGDQLHSCVLLYCPGKNFEYVRTWKLMEDPTTCRGGGVSDIFLAVAYR